MRLNPAFTYCDSLSNIIARDACGEAVAAFGISAPGLAILAVAIPLAIAAHILARYL